MNRDDPALICSFCGKTLEEVRELIAGAKAHICDECIKLCVDIIEEESAKEENREARDMEFHATLPRGRVSVLSMHASELATGAQLFANSCDAAVDLPRPVAERARALAEELGRFASSKAGSRAFLTEYALSVFVMARSFASACDAIELPGDIAERTRRLADEIETLFAPPVGSPGSA